MKAHHLTRTWFGLITLLALMLCNQSLAQPEQTLEAYKAYQQQDFQRASELIEQAILSDAGKNDAMSWHIRGFVYKDIFNQVDQKNYDSQNRDKAIESYFQSIELDKGGEYLENNRRSLRYLASSLYNDAVLIMRELDPKTIIASEGLFKRYKDLMVQSEHKFDEIDRDITFYKALATCYRKIYEQDRDANHSFLQRALESYQLVLNLDPDNYGANYNTAINLYNEGAYGIEQIDVEAQIPTIVKVQAESVELFREALPFMLKAFELDPTRRETLIALRGIYLSLNNNDEANKYRDLLRETQQTNKE